MGNSRIPAYWTKWKELALRFGDTCWYCREEAATTIDHVTPYSYAVDSSLENLRPACAFCNCLAGDRMFDSDVEKKWWIINRRHRRHDRNMHQCSCTECYVPYIYRTHSPSLFLCPECYDHEYGTDYANRSSWRKWLALLVEAEIWIDVFRTFRDLRQKTKNQVADKKLMKEAVRLVEAKQLAGLLASERT